MTFQAVQNCLSVDCRKRNVSHRPPVWCQQRKQWATNNFFILLPKYEPYWLEPTVVLVINYWRAACVVSPAQVPYTTLSFVRLWMMRGSLYKFFFVIVCCTCNGQEFYNRRRPTVAIGTPPVTRILCWPAAWPAWKLTSNGCHCFLIIILWYSYLLLVPNNIQFVIIWRARSMGLPAWP